MIAERPNPLRQAVKRGMTRALPSRAFLTRGPIGDSSVALTFDDGPHPEHTPRLLDVLGELDVRATFFVLGRQVEAHPNIVRRIFDEGHAVGHHSYSHGEPTEVSAAELAAELERTDALLTHVLGQPSRLFRPPHGKLTPAKVLRSWTAARSIVLWSVDPKDYACTDAREVAHHFETTPLVGGDVVLLHDTHPHAAEALPPVVREAGARGLSFDTVDRWTGR